MDKNTMIHIRVTEEEKSLIAGLARIKGLNVSNYLRSIIFNDYEKETGINLAAAVQARKNKGLE